ncbi:MAG: cytochrome c oxidase subunit II [Dehalococcoidia bacterium]|nr:cytochrome c oxidase subunit II [Dehalococcoidia bacterium]
MNTATWRKNFRRSLFIVSAAISALLLSVSVASAGWGQPSGITEEAERMHTLYLIVTASAAVVFVLVEVALVYIIFRYRKRSDELPPQTHGNNLLEVVWTSIPILIVIGLFVSAFVVLVDVEEDADPEALTIDVTGFQFQWEFAYNLNDLGPGSDPNADGTVSVIGTAANQPTLVIPVGEPVEFRLISNDVIHSFYIRDFLYKLDVVPGRDNRFTVTPKQTGEFIGQCAEYCGVDHEAMRFKLHVVERDEFDRYIADLQGGGSGNASARLP